MEGYQSELQNMFIQILGGLKHSMTEHLKAQGLELSPLHFIVLRSIHHIESCTSNALADYLRKDKGQITRLVKELVGKGLVEKVANPNDKRSQFLILSEQGSACFKGLQEFDFVTLANMREGISDAELAQFLSIGEKMAANLGRGL